MEIVKKIAWNEWINIIRNKTAVVLVSIFVAILLLASYIGIQNTQTQNAIREKYQTEVQSQWMAQPNRHPHRVAHYGYLAFREKSPLSFFEFGIESFVGNAVFLEAHRQNTINLSEAGFSNGMLRFGELSMALVLQLLVPLFIFFIGFGTIASLKENGVLKVILSQGVSLKTLILGKIVGIFTFTSAVFLSVMIFSFVMVLCFTDDFLRTDILIRAVFSMLIYAFYFGVCSWVTVMVSAYSKKAGNALVGLILLWMVCAIIMPKVVQTIGTSLYPSITKLQFEKAIEKDVSKEGNSHNPNDPHYADFKASILKKYGVDSVEKLPINYAGVLMAEGERISASIFNRHFDKLITTYQNQNSVGDWVSFINPYLLIRNTSMAISGTDLEHYVDFQNQAELYRYDQTQYLNSLHTTKLKYKNDKSQRIDSQLLKRKKTFQLQPQNIIWAIKNHLILMVAVLFWVGVMYGSVSKINKKNLIV